MPVFPLPLLTFVLASVACLLAWRLDLGRAAARNLFTLLFAIIGLASLLVALRFGYGVENVIPLQRAMPLLIGPAMYLGFAVLAVAEARMTRLLVAHFGLAIIGVLLPQVFPVVRGYYDLIIAMSYGFYCLALIMLWRRGPDTLSHARLEVSQRLRVWMLIAAGSLASMLIVDIAIAASFAAARQGDAVTLISYGSALSAAGLLILIIGLSQNAVARPETAPRPAATDALETRARALLTDSKLYLDTELSVERLAKRLHVPVRALSAAINQSQNMNVSQYVNGFRLRHAAEMLENSQTSVSKIAAQSGFLARSNFYREFQRVYGMSPASYRAARQDG